MKKRAALYVRVSTEEQKRNGLSVDNQIDSLVEYCNEHDMTYKVYSDAGISGHIFYKKRPALLQLIEDCQNGEVDIILFTRLDRWFRSVKDYYIVYDQLNGVPWRAIWEDYETETSGGVFKVNIMLSVAQSEAEKTGERIRNTFDYKRKNGEYVGGRKAPLGYLRDGKKYQLNPEQQEGIQAFFDTYLATLSQKKARDAALEHGIKIPEPTAYRILQSHVYYGGFPYIAEGATYITKEQYDFIQASKRKSPKYHQSTKNRYIFSGLVRCAYCGRPMAGSPLKSVNKKNPSIVYTTSKIYQCTYHKKGYDCPGSSIKEDILENYVIQNIDSELKNFISSVESAQEEDHTKEIASLKAKLKRIKLLFEMGDIELEEYTAKRDEIKEKLVRFEKKPATLKKAELPENWIDMYSELPPEEKRTFWANCVDSFVVKGLSGTVTEIKFIV